MSGPPPSVNPYLPCPPEQFANRQGWRAVWNYLSPPSDTGRAVLVVGASGSGKSSLLRHLEYQWQQQGHAVIYTELRDMPGAGFERYQKVLRELQGHTRLGWLKNLVSRKEVKNALAEALKAFPVVGKTIAAGLGAQEAAPTYYRLSAALESALKALSPPLHAQGRRLAIIFDNLNRLSQPDRELTVLMVSRLGELPGIDLVCSP